jgi:hypothetical protein
VGRRKRFGITTDQRQKTVRYQLTQAVTVQPDTRGLL